MAYTLEGRKSKRINSVAIGFVGQGISELRIHHGPGYRIYFERRGDTIIVLLCAGDKSTQAKDIRKAKDLAKNWSEDD